MSMNENYVSGLEQVWDACRIYEVDKWADIHPWYLDYKHHIVNRVY